MFLLIVETYPMEIKNGSIDIDELNWKPEMAVIVDKTSIKYYSYDDEKMDRCPPIDPKEIIGRVANILGYEIHSIDMKVKKRR